MKDSERGPHRQVRSKDRPMQRGAIPCGICAATFKTTNAAEQHRRDKHGVKNNGTDTDQGPNTNAG